MKEGGWEREAGGRGGERGRLGEGGRTFIHTLI